MNPWLVIAAIYFGLAFATAIIAVVCWDVYAWTQNRKIWAAAAPAYDINGNMIHDWLPVDPKVLYHSVSKETMYLAGAYPWAAVILSGVIAFGIGALCGHLFFPQIVPGAETL